MGELRCLQVTLYYGDVHKHTINKGYSQRYRMSRNTHTRPQPLPTPHMHEWGHTRCSKCPVGASADSTAHRCTRESRDRAPVTPSLGKETTDFSGSCNIE